MVTYNQEQFIEKAINSVLSQETNFNFRLIIGDDCSTDRTTSICEKYANNFPDKILLLKSDINKGIIRNYLRCFDECSAEYICILEGDDYWIDNLKIEDQATFLNINDKIGLVHSNYTMYKEEEKQYKKTNNNLVKYCLINQGYIYRKLIQNNFICPLTVMFRKCFLDHIDFSFLLENDVKTIDYFLWLNIALNSQIFYENKTYGVYRISGSSISNNHSFEKRIKFTETKTKILNYYIEKYPLEGLSKIQVKNNSDMSLLLRAIKTLNFKYIVLYSKDISIPVIFSTIKNYFKFYR